MLEAIRSKIAVGQFELLKHAVDQSILRNITVAELVESVATGEVNEDYPDDKYGPSCLMFGYTKNGRPIHE